MSARKRDGAPARAVIDIGSNTVRLVIYGGPPRAPVILLNEKVTARLGRDLTPDGGALPDRAMEQALAALARYVLLIGDYDVKSVECVATAAVREAGNGPAFLARVAELGLTPRLLSGEEEARAAADGVIAAFPGARGIVADLGGGSLELVAIEGGASHHGISLPLGTLRLPALLDKGGAAKLAKPLRTALADGALTADGGQPLYLVGGTWRAFAAYAMHAAGWPLSDPHAFTLAPGEADQMARKVARIAPAELAAIPGISSSRAAALPAAAELMRALIAELKPAALIVSSWGLREGILYQGLGLEERGKDPLLAAVIAFAAPRQGVVTEATRLAAWTSDVVPGSSPASERLRLAATLLALALARVEPNLRTRQAIEWALEKRWVAIDARGRAMLAAALLASAGKQDRTGALARLASEDELRVATGWGMAIRLARRLGAAGLTATLTSRLSVQDRQLVLHLAPERAAIAGESVSKDLAALAGWLGLAPEVRVGAF